MADPDTASHLPLRPTAFAVLTALWDGPRPGFEILELAEEGGTSILGPGTLYRLMRELRQRGWVERVPAPADEEDVDERRRYHALTSEGRRLVRLEAARLRRTLERLEGLDEGEVAG